MKKGVGLFLNCYKASGVVSSMVMWGLKFTFLPFKVHSVRNSTVDLELNTIKMSLHQLDTSCSNH